MEERNTKKAILHKAFILTYIGDYNKKNIKITKSELANLLKVSRPTIYHHLETLKKRGLIEEKEGDKKAKGSPVYLYLTNKADPQSMEFLVKMEKGLEAIGKLTKK